MFVLAEGDPGLSLPRVSKGYPARINLVYRDDAQPVALFAIVAVQSRFGPHVKCGSSAGEKREKVSTIVSTRNLCPTHQRQRWLCLGWGRAG